MSVHDDDGMPVDAPPSWFAAAMAVWWLLCLLGAVVAVAVWAVML